MPSIDLCDFLMHLGDAVKHAREGCAQANIDLLNMYLHQFEGDDFRAKHCELTFGLLEASLRELMIDKKIVSNGGRFSAKPKAFINWSDNKTSNVDSKDEKEWAPLEVENFEEVAAQIDEVAELLEKENGYMDKHHLEAEHTIEASKNLSASIRENTGTVLFKRLNHFLSLMERIIKIFDKTSRIGIVLSKLIALFTAIIP